MEVNDYYTIVKPQLNKLSKFNILDSLYVIRQYVLYSFNGYKLNEPDFRYIENSQKCKIPVYLADFLIANIIKYGSIVTTNTTLRDYKSRKDVISYWHNIYEECNRIAMEPNALIWLKSYVFTQYKMQHFEHIYYKLYKYYFLYKSNKVDNYIDKKMELNIHRYFVAVLFLFFYFTKTYSTEISKLYETMSYGDKYWSEKEIKTILDMVSIDLKTIKYQIKPNYDYRLIFNFYNDSLHVQKPIIVDKNKLYCPVPIYILNAAIEGLSYYVDLRSSADEYKEFAENFENYIGEQLQYYKNIRHSFNLSKEVVYKKNLKSSDWIIWDHCNIIFIDCKLKKMSIIGIQEITIKDNDIETLIDAGYLSSNRKREEIKKTLSPGLVKDIMELGVDLGKIFKCYLDYKNKDIMSLPYLPNLKFRAIVLTLEECYCNIYHIKQKILRVANEYIKVKTKKEHIFKESDFLILSSSDFDKNVPNLGFNNIDNFWSKLNNPSQEKDIIENSYLSNKFDDLFNSVEKEFMNHS